MPSLSYSKHGQYLPYRFETATYVLGTQGLGVILAHSWPLSGCHPHILKVLEVISRTGIVFHPQCLVGWFDPFRRAGLISSYAMEKRFYTESLPFRRSDKLKRFMVVFCW